MFYVYVLHSIKTGRFYTGSCADLERRLHEHNAGKSKATQFGLPWQLEFHEAFLTRQEALKKERYYKTGIGREELQRRLGSCDRNDDRSRLHHPS